MPSRITVIVGMRTMPISHGMKPIVATASGAASARRWTTAGAGAGVPARKYAITGHR